MRVTNTWAALALACALAAGACGRTEVPDPTERTEQALRDANLGDVSIEWDREARVARLQGSVASEDERLRAGEVASGAVGTGVPHRR